MDNQKVVVVGGGLSGCECAWQLAQRGISVELYEQKPEKRSPAHHSQLLGELVCSNSLRADSLENAVGLLKAELRMGGSLLLACADQCKVPAGGALAVDREVFAEKITEHIHNHPLITVISQEMTALPLEGTTVIATGPLTEGGLAEEIVSLCQRALDSTEGAELLHFYDAAAPIVSAESVDMNSAYFASRYGKGTADYINCPMNEAEYRAFWQEVTQAEEVAVHGFEDSQVFEGCKPIEVEARRGEDTLLYGCLKPVGLPDPKTGRDPYAVVQLRRDNSAGSMYNLVGFQTHLKFPEQQRVFSMIPALKEAEFLRYGVMHRNTYLQSPKLLNSWGKFAPVGEVSGDLPSNLYFAGQITGVEGYVESIASGWMVGVSLAWSLLGKESVVFPKETALGALTGYVCDQSVGDFQPMKMNFGLVTPLGYKVRRSPEEKKLMTAKQAKNRILAKKSLKIFREILLQQGETPLEVEETS